MQIKMLRFLGLLRPFVAICGLLMILLGAGLSFARAGSDGAYWLLSIEDESSGTGLLLQRPDTSERHSMRGFDNTMWFDWWSPDQKWLYFHTIGAIDNDYAPMILWRMRSGSRQAECVGRKTVNYIDAFLWDFTPSPNGEWIAYASSQSEPNSLYITRGGCESFQPIFSTQDEFFIDNYFWSPDGVWQYFYVHDFERTITNLHRVKPDGSEHELIAEALVDPPEWSTIWQWSPDGEWITLTACAGRAECSLKTVQADGSIQARIRDTRSFAFEVVWTIDSQWILFRDMGDQPEVYDIYRVRPDGTARERLTQHPGNEYLYGLTPDGEWILFGSEDTLYRMRPDGSDQHALIDGVFLPDNILNTLTVSNEWIFITDFKVDNLTTLYRLRFDGSDIQHLVTGPFMRNQWTITPDNKYLLSSYGEPTRDQYDPTLFRMKLDGSEQEHIPLESYYEPEHFSPLFNLPFRAWLVMLVGAVMMVAGVAKRELVA